MDIKLIKDIRSKTGASIIDCKNALKASGGDMQMAYELATSYFKKQQNKELNDEIGKSKETQIKQIKYDINYIIDLLDMNDIRYSLRKTADYLIGKYELGLSDDEKIKYGVQLEDLSSAPKIDGEIKSVFINHCRDIQSKLIELSSGSSAADLSKIIKRKISSKLEELNISIKKMSCLLFTPTLWSTTTDLSEGYKIEILQIDSLEEFVEGVINGFPQGYDETFRLTKNGVDLDELYEKSNGTFHIENESSQGETEFYVVSHKLRNAKKGIFISYGIAGDWQQINDNLLKEIRIKYDLQDSWSHFKIIDLFINKIS